MALFHLSVKQVKRSAGQSAVACAAYRAGEDLYSEFYGEHSDYTHKGGVVCSEILLPSYAPPEFSDRQTLWNAVERVEHGKKAQLAYSFDIALQNEFSLEENIALARQFLMERFVSRGMICDFAVHMPDRGDGGIPNPHFHVLCPIRPLDETGRWGKKQQRVYRLDEAGNRILDNRGKPLFDAVPTTDWGKQETLEEWRSAWADLCNAKFAEKGLDVRIDHRSYERQGLEIMPTVHEGPTVRAMEKKGIRTEKGEYNRWVKGTNEMLLALRDTIAALLEWLKSIAEEIPRVQSPSLGTLVSEYYAQRGQNAYSQKGRVSNTKAMAATVLYLQEHGISTVEDLETQLSELNSRVDGLLEQMKPMSARMEQIKDQLTWIDHYEHTKYVMDELKKIKFKGAREKYRQEHQSEFTLYYAAVRHLQKAFKGGRYDRAALSAEKRQLEKSYGSAYTRYKAIKDDLAQLRRIKKVVDEAMHSRNNQVQQHETDRHHPHGDVL